MVLVGRIAWPALADLLAFRRGADLEARPQGHVLHRVHLPHPLDRRGRSGTRLLVISRAPGLRAGQPASSSRSSIRPWLASSRSSPRTSSTKRSASSRRTNVATRHRATGGVPDPIRSSPDAATATAFVTSPLRAITLSQAVLVSSPSPRIGWDDLGRRPGGATRNLFREEVPRADAFGKGSF